MKMRLRRLRYEMVTPYESAATGTPQGASKNMKAVITINTIAGQASGVPFPVAGTINYFPTLSYSNDGSTFNPVPAAGIPAFAVPANTTYQFTHEGMPAVSGMAITVKEPTTGDTAVSNTFAVATGHSIVPNAPSGAVAGVASVNFTGSLLHYNTTPTLVYAIGSGAAAPLGGVTVSGWSTSIPTPTASGSYTITVSDTLVSGSVTFSVASPVHVITPGAISGSVVGLPVLSVGSLAGFTSVPTLHYAVDGGTAATLAGVTQIGWSTSLVLPTSGSHTIVFTEVSGTASGSVTFSTVAAVSGASVTWDSGSKSATITLSNGNKTATTSTAVPQTVRANVAAPSGVLTAFEIQINTVTADATAGIINTTYDPANHAGIGSDVNSLGYYVSSPPQVMYYAGVAQNAGYADGASVNGDFVSFVTRGPLVWASTAKMRAVGNNWNNSPTADPATNVGGVPITAMTGAIGVNAPIYPAFNSLEGGTVATIYGGDAGFSAWFTTYLAAHPAIIYLSGGSVVATKTITPTAPTGVVAGTAFEFDGNITGFTSVPTLDYQLDGGTATALSGVTVSGWSTTLTASTSGAHTLAVSGAGVSGSVSFTAAASGVSGMGGGGGSPLPMWLATTYVDVSTDGLSANLDAVTVTNQFTEVIPFYGARVITKNTYFEVTAVDANNSTAFGIGPVSGDILSGAATMQWHIDGTLWTDGGFQNYGSWGAWTSGDILCIAVDITNGKVYGRVGVSGLWCNAAAANPATNVSGTAIPASILAASGIVAAGTMYFYQNTISGINAASGFAGVPPVGFSALEGIAVPGISVFTPRATVVGTPFNFQGSLIDFSTAPVLDYQLDGGTATALTGVTSTGWSESFTMTVSGTHTLSVSGAGVSGSVSFVTSASGTLSITPTAPVGVVANAPFGFQGATTGFVQVPPLVYKVDGGSFINLTGVTANGWFTNLTVPTAGTHTIVVSGGGVSGSVTFTATAAVSTGGVPAIAAAVGFNTQTYGPSFTLGTPAASGGANIFPFDFFGESWVDIYAGMTVNADGSISMNGASQNYGDGLCTAMVGPNGATSRTNIEGKAFGGGGYFEAIMAFDGPASFWANDIENMNGGSLGLGSVQWPGGPTGESSWFEADIMEMDAKNRYGWSMHNWNAAPGATQPSDVAPVWGGPIGTFDGTNWSPPAGVDYTKPNSYGFLWVPATSTTPGYVKFFFNRVQVGITCNWNLYNPALPPPPVAGAVTITGESFGAPTGFTAPNSAWSMMDSRHLAFIFGGSVGSTVTVYSMTAWQASDANNITTAVAPPTPPVTGTRKWYEVIGGDRSMVTTPQQTTAKFLGSGSSLVTQLRGLTFANVRSLATTNFVSPLWVSLSTSDILCTFHDSTGTIADFQMRVPAGSTSEGSDLGPGDNSACFMDKNSPYKYVTINDCRIGSNASNANYTNAVSSTNNFIMCGPGTGTGGAGGMIIQDATGPTMMDALTHTISGNIWQNGDNGSGSITYYDLQQLNADANYVVQHMITCNLGIDVFSSTGQTVWPLIIGDTPRTGSIPEGVIIMIPASVTMPTGQTRAFKALWDIFQQQGCMFNNVTSAGQIGIKTMPNDSATATLVAAMLTAFPSIIPYLDILHYEPGVAGAQYSVDTLKGKLPGAAWSDAFPAPPTLDFSQTGGVPVLPSTFGAWQAANGLGEVYNVIWPGNVANVVSGSGGGGTTTPASFFPNNNPPAQAAAVGYTVKTLGDNVVMGTNWYPFDFFGITGISVTTNSDGSVAVHPPGDDFGAQICTATVGTWLGDPTVFGGKAFGGGGYFEVIMSAPGPFSFWADDIEALNSESIGKGAPLWGAGQPAVSGHWIEVDFAEFDTPGVYGGAIHDWYGPVAGQNVATSTLGSGSPFTLSGSPNFANPNTYGFLWVPATATTQGYGKWFFNNVQVGNTITWNKFDPTLNPPPVDNGTGGSSAYSVLDTRHLALILGAGATNDNTVYGVRVWQATNANNLGS